MSTSAKTLTPEQQEALAKFNAYLQTRGGTVNPFLQYIDPESKGGAWTDKKGKSSGAGFGFEGMLDQIGQRLSGKGITAENIGQLAVREVDGPPLTKQVQKFYDEDDGKYSYKVLLAEGDDQRWVDLAPEQLQKVRTEQGPEGDSVSYIDLPQKVQEVYDKATGKTVSSGQSVDLGGWGQGPGMTYGSLTFDEKGKPKISTYGEDTNWFADKGPLMAALKFTPIGPVVAVIDAIQSYYNYGDPTKAILAAIPYTGILDSIAGTAANVAGPAGELAANSGIAGLAQNLGVSADLANKIGQIGAQGVLSGTISTGQGKGFLPGAKSGVVSGLVNEGINVGVNAVAPDMVKGLGSFYAPAKSLATSMLTAGVTGKPFDIGEAVKGAAINYGLNQAIGAGGKALNIDPKQQAAMLKFLNFAAPMIAAQRRKP